MAYAMTKQGSLDNCVTYEFMCDTVEDMNAIEDRYRTIGSVAIVLQGNSGLEVYIASSDKQWNSFSGAGAGSSAAGAGLSIHICGQNEVENGLPNVSEPDEATIYLVPASDSSSGNLYDEYVYVADAWEKFGSSGSAINLSAYATKANPVFSGSISLGRASEGAIGENSVAEGHNVVASGDYSHAEGCSELDEESKTIDSTTYTAGGAYGEAAHAEGWGTLALGDEAHTEGQGTIASGQCSHAEGTTTTASGTHSHAEGEGTNVSGTAAHAEGSYTTAAGNYAHSEGHGNSNSTKTIGSTKYAGTGAHGESSHAEGGTTWAIGISSHAEGSGTTASGYASHAEGGGTTASGANSHAEGAGATASGTNSHAEGAGATASGYNSHAEGTGTTASGANSHVEGQSTTASGANSHVEGQSTTASGDYSHAEGYSTIAAGAMSHAGGAYNVADSYANWPEWTANTQYEVGDKVKRTSGSGTSQTAVGYVCRTANSDASFTSSKWINQNGQMNYVEIIGNGTSSARSNARALDWDGNERLKGNVYVGCNADSTGGEKVATEAYVNARIPTPPAADGTYTLQVTVSNGKATYSWI